MKLLIKQEFLNEKLNIVSKAISSKNIIPVLSGIKFDLTKEGLFLTTTDDDICIETFIDKKNIKEINELGSIIIPGKYFLEIIRKLNDEYINIVTDGLKIIISTERGEYSLNGMDYKEFPNIKFELLENPIRINNQILKNIITQTVFAVSNQESRPILTGINLKIEDNILICNATDSYRLATKTIKLDKQHQEKINIVIPGKNLLELIKLFNEDDEIIELHIFQNNITIKTETMIFQSRLLNGTYPDISKLIPNEFELILSINLIEFYNTIDRVSLLTSEKDKNLVKMEINNNELILSSTSQEIGTMEEKMIISKNNDTNMKIAFSSKYMLDALRSFKCENIELKLNGEIKPIIIKNSEDDSLIQLVLPIKTF